MKSKPFIIVGIIILIIGGLYCATSVSTSPVLSLLALMFGILGFACCSFFSSALDYLEKIRNSNKKMREMMEAQIKSISTPVEARQEPTTESTD